MDWKPLENPDCNCPWLQDGNSAVVSLNGTQLVMNNKARSRAPLPGFSSFVWEHGHRGHGHRGHGHRWHGHGHGSSSSVWEPIAAAVIITLFAFDANDLYLSPTREVTSQSAVKSKAVFSFVIRISPVIVFHTQALFVPSLSSTQSIFQTYVALNANYLPLFYNYVIHLSRL